MKTLLYLLTMTSILLLLTFISCVSSGSMLSMLLLLIVAYVTAALWLIVHQAIYSGLLYILVYVGAIVVLIMFVVQLTNTTLTVHSKLDQTYLILVQNTVLVMAIAYLISIAYHLVSTDLLYFSASFNLDSVANANSNLISASSFGSHTLGPLASSIFNEHGYILILSVHAIILAVIGPIKLALSDYVR